MTKIAATLACSCCLVGACAHPAATDAPASPAQPMASPAQQVERDLQAMGEAARAFFVKNQGFPMEETAQLPATSCCEQNFAGKGQCAPAPDLFANPPWSTLGFHPERPLSFQYQYTGVRNAATFTLTAVGDLDCDGTTITYTLVGNTVNEQPEISLVKPDLSLD